MSRSYQTSFDSARSPMSNSPSSALSPDAFKTNIHRNKTKRWVEAPKVDYGGGWGDDDEYDDYDDPAPSNAPSSHSNTGTVSSVAAPRPLQRQNSFDRGDDDVVVSPIGQGTRATTWQLPPTPSELEERERMGSVPQIRLQQSRPPPPPTAYPPQIHVETPQLREQDVPIIRVPTTGQPAAASKVAATMDQQPQSQLSPRDDETSPPTQAPQALVPAPVPPINQAASQSYGSRERVPPPFGVEPATQSFTTPINVEDKHVPQISNEVCPQEGEGAPGPSTPVPNSPQEAGDTTPQSHDQTPDVYKPTPPLPPPEDTCLKTISEHDSAVSGPSSPTNIMAPMMNTPSYDDYTNNYYGEDYGISQSSTYYEESLAPLYAPSLPSAEQQPVTSSPSPPANPTAKPKFIRPSDIYKRHQFQEEFKQQTTGDSSRASIESAARPSIDVQNPPSFIDVARPPTRESMDNRSQLSDPTTLPQQRSRVSSEEFHEPPRDNSRPPSGQGKGQVDSQISQDDPSRPGSESGEGTFTIEPSSHPPVELPAAAPASSFVPEDPPKTKTPETPSWGEDIIAGYATSAMDTTTSNKSDYFTPLTSQSRVASSASVPQLSAPQLSASPQQEATGGHGFQTIVDTAFVRQDTLLPTPLSDTSVPDDSLSPILPPPPVPPKEESGKWKSSYVPPSQGNTSTPNQDDQTRELQQLSLPPGNKRAPSPDAWREGARRSSTPVILPPVLTESAGIMDEATPVDTREKDELVTYILQLERAQTPVPQSPDTPKQASEIHTQTGPDTLDAPQTPSNPRESVFSLYDSYWEDGDQAPAALAHPPPPPPIQPKSPLRGVRSIEGPMATQQSPSPQPEAPKGRSPLPPPAVSIPAAPKNAEELATPASSVDEELLEMMSTGNRFLDRRGTGFSVSSSKDRAESKPQLSPVMEPENKTLLPPPVIGPDFEGIQVIPPVKQLGPESEGIEAITGPTVEKRPKSKEEEDAPIESEFAKELVSQFSRPQTLMLKETMPMPTGMLVMPSMPPLPGKEDGEVAPEVVNFDKDDAEGLEAIGPDAPGLEPVHHHHEDGLQVSPPSPPPGDANQSRPESAQTTSESVKQMVVLQDTEMIATLSTPVERTKAYDALRRQITESPDPLSEWTTHQMEHNNGEQLLKTEMVTIKSELSVKKSKSKMGMGMGHFPRRSGDHHHYEDGSSLRAEEKLSQMGKGALKLGGKAGEKVGGWMKRVGKKGHANKDSMDGEDNGMYKSVDETREAPIASTVSLTGSYATSEHMSAASSSTATVRERGNTIGTPNMQSTVSLPPQRPVSQQLPQSQPYSSAPALQLPHIQTQFQTKFQPSQPTPSPIQRFSGEETRQHTPNQYYHPPPVNQATESGPRSASSPYSASIVTSPPPSSSVQQPAFPARTDSLQTAAPSGTGNTAPRVPAPAPAAFPRRGDSLQHSREVSLSGPPLPQPEPPEKLPPPKEDSDDEDLYSIPAKPKQAPLQGKNPTPSPPQQGQYVGQITQQMSPLQHLPPLGTLFPQPQPSHPSQHGPYRPEQTQQILPSKPPQGYAPPPGQNYPPPSQASHGPSPAGYTAQFPGPRQPQQPQQLQSQQPQSQQPQSQQLQSQQLQSQLPQAPPPSRGSSLVKTLSGLSSSHKRSTDQPPGSSSSSEKKGKDKRSSFLGNLGSKLDSGVGRSASVSSLPWTGDPNVPPPKMVKRGSLLTKLGQKQKKAEDGKAPKGHKKGFSGIFTRSGSTSGTPDNQTNKKFGKLAKARLLDGGSGGATALIQEQPKIYDARTGQYVTYEQTIQRSMSAPYAPPQQVRASPPHNAQQPMMQQPAGFQNPPHPTAVQQSESYQPGYGPPPSQSSHTYPQGAPSQRFGQQHQPLSYSQTTIAHSRQNPQISRHHSVAAAYHTTPPLQQQPMHDGPELHDPAYPPQPQQQNIYGPNSGSPEMLARQPAYPLHESQGRSQGMPPTPNYLHQQGQGAPPRNTEILARQPTHSLHETQGQNQRTPPSPTFLRQRGQNAPPGNTEMLTRQPTYRLQESQGQSQGMPPPPNHLYQQGQGAPPGNTEMLTRQPTYHLHESQGRSQGMPPPSNFLHQQEQGAPPSHPHPRDYHQQYPGYQQYGAPLPAVEPAQHPQSTSPQHQLQYVPPIQSPDHTGYQSPPPPQPQPQPQPQQPSQPPQLPPLPRFDSALSRQPTQSSAGDSVYSAASHRGSVAESGGRPDSIPSPPQQYGVISRGGSIADRGVGTELVSPPLLQQYRHAQSLQQSQSSPQLSRAGTVASDISGISVQAPPSLPAPVKAAAQSSTQAPGSHLNSSPTPPANGGESPAAGNRYNVPQPPSSDAPHESYTKTAATSTSKPRTLSMGSDASGGHGGGISLIPGNINPSPSPPPPSENNGLNTPPSTNTPSTVTDANSQPRGGVMVKQTFDHSESSKDVGVSVASSPKSKEKAKDMEVEEKIAVRHEGDGEKEVFIEEKKPGNGKKDEDDEDVRYSMSSTAYPGQWEPEYYGWS
ncbi:hypothetical protein BDD12DRAFT_883891 [Trichophaea hybrida]|nr:hypothetical protein BDD12DRAFT_883891 [Trichophaea hybrida]